MAEVPYPRLGELIDHLVRAGVNNWRLGVYSRRLRGAKDYFPFRR